MIAVSTALAALLALLSVTALIADVASGDFGAARAGRAFALVVMSGALVYLLLRNRTAGRRRSWILSNIALSCGLAAFWRPESLGWTWVNDMAVGGLRGAVAAVGIWAAVAAYASRHDGGTGRVRPILGGVLSLLHLAASLLVFVITSDQRAGGPWVYEAPRGMFRITLPSKRWRQLDVAGTQAQLAFGSAVPRMQAGIVLRGDRTDAQFVELAAGLDQSFRDQLPLTGPLHCREGVNEKQRPVRYCSGIVESRDGERAFIGRSLTWLDQERSIVEVTVEGSLTMLSELGKKHAGAVVEQAAEQICLSVE